MNGKHRFGGPTTNGTEHCLKCGTIKLPNGSIVPNRVPLPKGFEPADCDQKSVLKSYGKGLKSDR